jgi:predicted amidohydrolase
MRLAIGQIEVTEDKVRNRERIEEYCARAARAGADLVLFPESAMVRFVLDHSVAANAEPIDGPFTTSVSAAAKRYGLTVVAGMYECSPDEQRPYNTMVCFAPDGSFIDAYRKIHLFDAFSYRESEWLEPGPGDTVVFSVAGARVGVMTCYDLRFPELARRLAQRGADIILLAAAWTHGVLKEDHWVVLARARAIENTLYVAAADQVGGVTSGRSMLIDPMGVPIAASAEVEDLLVGTVDPARTSEVRAKLPSLTHVRPDLYAEWAQRGIGLDIAG